jgi:hypothetical protein
MKDNINRTQNTISSCQRSFLIIFYVAINVLFVQTFAKANSPEEPPPVGAATIMSLYYFNGNVHFIVETPEFLLDDHAEIIGGKIRLSIIRKSKDEEKVLYDCYEFSGSDACNIYQRSTGARKFILDIVDPCVENGKYLYVVSQYDEDCKILRWDDGLAKEGAEITVPAYDGECQTNDPFLSQECRYHFIQNENRESNDSSCGCSSLSTGDPAGILTATMLLFAFFALAFERIRRKK